MKPYFITFGHAHKHDITDAIIDRDCVVQIIEPSYEQARARAFELFDDSWSNIYEDLPNMTYFPRGIVEL